MVNPGAFGASRKVFLMSQKPDYSAGVMGGYAVDSVYRSGLLDRKKTGKRLDQTGNLTGPQLRSFRLKMKNRKKTG
jgi:hypothetical protein